MKMKSCSQIGIAIVFTALAVVTIMDRAKQPHTETIDTNVIVWVHTNFAYKIVDHTAKPWGELRIQKHSWGTNVNPTTGHVEPAVVAIKGHGLPLAQMRLWLDPEQIMPFERISPDEIMVMGQVWRQSTNGFWLLETPTNRPVGMTNNVWHDGIIQNESPKYQEELR